jgi:rhamnosyltransferase
MLRFCVLLAAYNGSEYLLEQLESIYAQCDIELDIYISLDVSNDNSEKIIIDYSEGRNIKLLNSKVTFGSAGKNFFHLISIVDFSGYDFVAFADQDDIWEPVKLIEAVKFMELYSADGYSSNVKAFWENGNEKLIKKSDPQTKFDFLFESAGPGCTFVMTCELSISIQNFIKANSCEISGIWLHDWFCYAFARVNGFKWVIDKNSYMFYRQHTNNSVGANSGIRSFLKRISSVMNGDAFDKVIYQARVLAVDNLKPIILLKNSSFKDTIELLMISHQCRRSKRDKVLFFFAILLSTFRRGN